jgi:hypothetical protein
VPYQAWAREKQKYIQANINEPVKPEFIDSRGHWEGNTLVVEVRNNNSKSRLSNVGDFASEKLHIVERYTFLDGKSMKYEATLDDPSVYTRPWTIASDFHRVHTEPGYE